MKKLIIALGGVGLAYLAYVTYMVGHDTAIQERFPDLDPEIVARIHREMARDSLQGRLTFPDDDAEADAFLDAELLRRYHQR